MKILTVLAVTLLGTVTFSPASASASAAERDGYDVICITQTLPDGQKLPKVCVPIPVPLPV